jgi:hypothetical protein
MSAVRKMARRVSGTTWVLLISALLPAWAAAEETADPAPTPGGFFDQIQQTGCSSCSSGLLGSARPSYLSPPGTILSDGCDGCGEGGCFPGRQPCAPCEGKNCFSRMCCALHDCICCPDPCYEPRWIGAANAAMFVDGARPVTQTRLRWDAGVDMILPDRAEYFWAQDGGKGPKKPETRLNYHELSIYTEAATEKFAVTFEMPYRSLDPQVNNGAAGFGDLKIGTKSLFLDCELIQMSFQFVTTVPSGNFLKGLGVGHVSLEPSILAAVKLYPETYLQMQLSEWIPIGGTDGVQGGIFHYHFSFNHVICRPVTDTQLVGMLEFNGWTFQNGGFTDPVLGQQPANNFTYLSVGPGFRFIICDKVDIGFGASFSVTNQHFADQLYRTELRWRF